jgi:hypothetical protein
VDDVEHPIGLRLEIEDNLEAVFQVFAEGFQDSGSDLPVPSRPALPKIDA